MRQKMCRHKIRKLSVLDGAAKGPSYKQRAVSVTLHASWDLCTYVNWLYRKRSTPLNDQTMKIYDNQAIKASMEPSRNAGTWSSGTSKAVFSVRPMLEPYTSVSVAFCTILLYTGYNAYQCKGIRRLYEASKRPRISWSTYTSPYMENGGRGNGL